MNTAKITRHVRPLTLPDDVEIVFGRAHTTADAVVVVDNGVPLKPTARLA